ncbi:hypothetical protein D3C75_387010 [compost metagenome]
METIIWFAKNEKGVSQVEEYMKQMITDAKNNLAQKQLVDLVMQALEYLGEWGIPYSQNEFFVADLNNNSLYSIKLVKELKDHPPLLEFRVNWRGAGAFRAVFFEYRQDMTQILIFVEAIVKESTFSLQFEEMVLRCEQYYDAFMKSPEKYIILKGDEEVE